MNPIAHAAEDAGRKIVAANEANLGDQLNAAVGQFAGWPYKVASGRAVDGAGGKAGPFASIVYVSQQGGCDLNAIQADTVAAVIDARETADLDMLRVSYARITEAKRLKKSPAPHTGVPTTTVTLGIIFALRS